MFGATIVELDELTITTGTNISYKENNILKTGASMDAIKLVGELRPRYLQEVRTVQDFVRIGGEITSSPLNENFRRLLTDIDIVNTNLVFPDKDLCSGRSRLR